VVVLVVGSGESLESDGRHCVGAFERNLASVAVKHVYAFVYIKIYFKLCTLMRRVKIMLQ
jgi:hypothetical protein